MPPAASNQWATEWHPDQIRMGPEKARFGLRIPEGGLTAGRSQQELIHIVRRGVGLGLAGTHIQSPLVIPASSTGQRGQSMVTGSNVPVKGAVPH